MVVDRLLHSFDLLIYSYVGSLSGCGSESYWLTWSLNHHSCDSAVWDLRLLGDRRQGCFYQACALQYQ